MNSAIIKLPNGDFTTSTYVKDHFYYEGHLGPKKAVKIQKYMMIGDKVYETHNVVVHKFQMGDVEDPDLYAGQPLWEWQQSEMGKWVLEHSLETPMWHRHADPMTYGYSYAVTAYLKGPDYSFWVLKWGDQVDRPGRVTV